MKPDSATLSITADRRVFWKDERMSDEQLAQRLHASALRQPQPEDFMRGDRQAGLPARRPSDGGGAEIRGVSEPDFVTDPGGDQGDPKGTQLHRHARPDANVSSSAAPIATPATPVRCAQAHRLIFTSVADAASSSWPRFAGKASVILLGCPPWHGSSRH